MRRTWRGPSARPSPAGSWLQAYCVLCSPPSGYPGDLPYPAKGAGIKDHDDEDQSTLQRGTLGVRQERHAETELRRVAPNRDRREGDIQLLAREPAEKFPARFALGMSRPVASRPTVAIVTLDRPNTTGPPVNATIETKKISTRTTYALPANTVRNSRVVGFASSELTTDTATTSNPKMAADAPALAAKKPS